MNENQKKLAKIILYMSYNDGFHFYSIQSIAEKAGMKPSEVWDWDTETGELAEFMTKMGGLGLFEARRESLAINWDCKQILETMVA